MPTIVRKCICLLGLALSACVLPAAEYFVAADGDDTHPGTSRAQAFATVQKGLDALDAGDTLTILPGEYREHVARAELGHPDVETVIRAAIPGTVLLRGDVPAPTFQPVDGFRHVYAAEFVGDVQAVNEVDTLTILETRPTPNDLEFALGGCHYDPQRRRLFISPSDGQPPSRHAYTVSVTPQTGMLLTRPTRVVIEGLAATGFTSREHAGWEPGSGAFWGILLDRGSNCVVRGCIAYLNGGGIALRGSVESRDNLIVQCTAYGNYSKHCTEGGNIIGFSKHYDEIRECYAYKGRPNGMRFYGAGIEGPVLLSKNLAWGNSYTDFFIKGGAAGTYGVAERCIALGICHAANVTNCLIGRFNQYNRTPAADNVMHAWLRRDAWPREYADPDQLDFRLQSTSSMRGSGPGGSDRGPFPYEANIFYVASDGNDAHDGLSMKTAWRTLDHALRGRRGGETVYLAPGIHESTLPWGLSLDGRAALSIRGRGREPVIVRGNVTLHNVAGLRLERLHFEGAVQLQDSRDVVLNNCSFSGPAGGLSAERVTALRITHSLFTERPLQLTETDQVYLSANLYAPTNGPALRLDALQSVGYSDYNGYADATRCWETPEATLPLSELQPEMERHALVQPPELVFDNGYPRVENAHAFAGRGPNGSAVGRYHEYAPRPLRLDGPLVHSRDGTTANIEWWISHPAATEIAWGPTPDCAHTNTVRTQTFGSFSLTGLTPATRYYFRIVSAEPSNESTAQTIRGIRPDQPPVTFQTTNADHDPRRYVVAPDGDDHRNDGLTRETAWRTVAHAAGAVRAGDTVHLAGGTYTETIFVRVSGDVGRPVTFTSLPGEKAILSGAGRTLATAFVILGKQHVTIDGLYFEGFGMEGWDGVLNVMHSEQVRITRCFFNGRGVGYPGMALRTDRSRDVTVRDCVIANQFQGMYLQGTPGLRLENNVFLRNMIAAFLSSGSGPRGCLAAGNIFVDSGPNKVMVHMFELGGIDPYVFRNNCFYLRSPDEERKPFLFYGNGPGRLSVAEYDARVAPSHSLLGNPGFEATRDMEPVLVNGVLEPYFGDRLAAKSDLDFPDLFVTDPEALHRGIGLRRERFKGFWFEQERSNEAP